MKDAIENGGDYVKHDLQLPPGPAARLPQPHGRADEQCAGALLRTSFEISTSRPTARPRPALHRAVLDAVIARSPQKAEKASLVLIDGAAEDIEEVLASRRKLPSVSAPPPA
jgi:hypothetical protein